MSKLDKFAAAVKDDSAINEHQAQMAAERARRPFHDAWLADVYPSWQGPMARMSKASGVQRAAHLVEHKFPPAANAAEVMRDIAAGEGRVLSWLVTETIEVSTSIGITAHVSYSFAGDVNDGVMSRVVSATDRNRVIDVSRVRTWTGPLEALTEAAVEDIVAAATMFDDALIQGLVAKRTREADEKRQAEENEKKRIADEAAERAAEAEEKRRKEQAALVESERLAAEAKAKAEAEVPKEPTPPAPEEPSAVEPAPAPVDPDTANRRRRK